MVPFKALPRVGFFSRTKKSSSSPAVAGRNCGEAGGFFRHTKPPAARSNTMIPAITMIPDPRSELELEGLHDPWSELELTPE